MAKAKKKEDPKVKEKQGQSWSIDLIIGVIIFMLVIAVFYALLTSKSEPSIAELQGNAGVITTKLTDEDNEQSNILINGMIDGSKFDQLCDLPYDEVKSLLGVEHDFCIYIEDENGNIIPCGTYNKTGIGNSQDINLTTRYKCGELIS